MFGGDGATLAIPGTLAKRANDALIALQRLSSDQFSLALRVALVPVADLHGQGHVVKVGKYIESALVEQAIFSGSGWMEAENWLKSAEMGRRYVINDDGRQIGELDLSGLECRWEPIGSVLDHKLCLIVLALAQNTNERVETYNMVYETLRKIYGDTDEHHPVSTSKLNLTLKPSQLWFEAVTKVQGSWRQIGRQIIRLIIYNLFGKIFFRFGINTKSTAWSRYQEDLIRNTDYKKFDGAIKMVLDGSNDQLTKIERHLREWRQLGLIAYGLHTSKNALLTCMVVSHNQDHVHFVDGAEGGYTLAAKSLKLQLAESTGASHGEGSQASIGMPKKSA
jgi:hypothetical protein